MAVRLNSEPPDVVSMVVIVTHRSEGAGTQVEPVRKVTYIHTLEGELIGRLDDMEEEARNRLDSPVRPWRPF